jgi:shikimate dehydrogenase
MFGLVGKKLEHSFSEEIHGLFGNKDYKLYETGNIEEFIKANIIRGINVTIPYKTDIIPYLDDLGEIARETLSVNTIVSKKGKLVGYNTDYYGLKETFSYYNVIVENMNILVLGNGSVSKTVLKLMNDLGAKNIVRLSRQIRGGHDDLFSNYEKYIKYDIIINTTPVGMYPNNDDELLINLDKFDNIDCVIDLVYNPIKTKLVLKAEKLGIKALNGLYMLVMQAKKAHEIFFNKEIPLNIANKIYRRIYSNHLNYVFIGLPLSGKTKYARIIGDFSNKTTQDTDDLIEKKYNSSIPDIFATHGEKIFREYEHSVVEDIYKWNSLVISTGGGLIENSANMELLKQNGIIIYLNKDPNIISKKKIYGRPLLKQSSDILVLAKRRVPLYMEYADFVINIKMDTNTHVNEIKERVDEYISR